MPHRNLDSMAGATSRRPPFGFSASTRVGFSDTDAQGIVYYGRYAPYFDIARVEYWRHLGFSAHDEPDVGEFVMRAFSIEYHAPATFDDMLEVFCRVSRLGTSSMTFEYAVVHVRDEADRLLATSTQTLVNIDLQARRPVPISDRFRRQVHAFEGELQGS